MAPSDPDISPPDAPHRRVLNEIKKDSESHKADLPNLLPSPEVTTNLLIADIVLRSASRLFRRNVERRIVRSGVTDEEAALEGSTFHGPSLLTSVALYGASKMATRSPLGLGVVAGGLILKTLYDRGKAKQKREAEARFKPENEA
ncbi:MAG: hypothetical protein AAFW59_03730 [Pseudomonadota bacterium]